MKHSARRSLRTLPVRYSFSAKQGMSSRLWKSLHSWPRVLTCGVKSQEKSIRGFKRPSLRPTEIDAKTVEVDSEELRGSVFLSREEDERCKAGGFISRLRQWWFFSRLRCSQV